MTSPPRSYRGSRLRIRGRIVRILLRTSGSAALVAVLLASSLKFPYIDHATIALLLLGAVVGIGAYGGTLEALVAAMVGGVGFDYFYLPPHGFGIEKPEHWIALGIFLFVAASA